LDFWRNVWGKWPLPVSGFHPASSSSPSPLRSMVEGDWSTENVTPLPTIEKFLQRRNLMNLSICYVFKIFSESDGHTWLGTVQKFTVGLWRSCMTYNILFWLCPSSKIFYNVSEAGCVSVFS
jgi:hypothetical protein